MTSTEDRIKTLRKCTFLQGLKEGVLAELAKQADELRVKGGTTIVTRGETGSNMYFVISGRARVHDGEVTLASIDAGEVFGEMAVLDSEVRSATVSTECDSYLLSIERRVFYEALSVDPSAFKAVIHSILERERDIIHEFRTRSSRLLAYEKELEIGRRIQADFLPGTIPAMESWELASHFEAAREVAGDFFDVFNLKSGPYLALVIGDVCDKGVGAALFMTLFRSLIRATSLYGHLGSSLVDEVTVDPFNSVEEVLLNSIHTTNRYIATTHAGSSMFASVFFGLLDTESGELLYINAGHEAPIIFRRNSQYELLDTTGGVVGLFPAANYEVKRVKLNRGDLLFAYTDGINEAKDIDGQQFGDQRILDSCSPDAVSPEAFLSIMLENVSQFRGEAAQSDDITMLALRYLQADAPG